MATSSPNYRIISADGQSSSRPTCGRRTCPRGSTPHAPAREGSARRRRVGVVPGAPPMPIGLVTNAGEWGKRYEDNEWYGWTYDNIHAGAFDGKERLVEQDIDGVDAEVIYPSQRTMGTFMAQEDDDYHLAGLEAYNTWMHRVHAVDPSACSGWRRCPPRHDRGQVAARREGGGVPRRDLSAYPSGGAELSADDDPFWDAAEHERLPVHIHSGLSMRAKRKTGPARARRRGRASFGALPGLQQMGGAVAGASEFMSGFIFSGMFDRFPGLQMAAVECGAGWVPHFLEHMDDHWWRNRVWTESALERCPASTSAATGR